MPIDVFMMVIFAALVHAAWNALVKSDGDRLTLIKIMSLAQLALSLLLLPLVAVPPAEAWPYLIASAIMNIGYVLFLNQAYRSGDLSHAYPLARGAAPLIVAAISIVFLGETLSLASQLAVMLIGLGITSLSITRGVEGLRDLRMVSFALGAGGFIAAYTLLDGLGARAAGSPHDYMVWVSIVASALNVATTHVMRGGGRRPAMPPTLKRGVAAGLASYFSSWLVIWAMTLAPIPLVSALRETSIVFAVAIGVIFLKERLNLARLISVATTLAGTMILKFSR
jgi:drug/metabolite transporter (DMT)-like permease